MTPEIERIRESDLTDLDKIALCFEQITGQIIAEGQREIELARAMQDEEAVVRTQIKTSTLNHARDILQTCYRTMLRRSAWDENEER
jgi:hypothetical protein